LRDLFHVLNPPDLLLNFLTDNEKIKQKYPQGYEHTSSLYYLYQQIFELEDTAAKLFIGHWLMQTFGEESSAEVLYQEFSLAISAAKSFREDLLREFATEKIRFAFTSDGIVRPTNDPLELLKMMWHPFGNHIYAIIRSFEANLFWSLGLRYMIMMHYNTSIEGFLSKLTLRLEEKFFSADKGSDFKEELKIAYDPENSNRFVKCLDHDESAEHVFIWPLWFRFVQIGDRYVKLLYHSRSKRPQDLFRKILVKSSAESPMASDADGITFVFFSIEDIENAYKLLKEYLFNNYIAMARYNVNGQGGATNKFSSGIFPPEKHFRVWIWGRWLEVQIFTFQNYFNRKFSIGDENHHLYRLRQIFDLLKLIAPPIIYGVDWENEELRKRFEKIQTNRTMVNFD